MQWMELIQLRSAASNRKLLESKLQGVVEHVRGERKKKTITAYSREWIDTDFCIHIVHDSKKVEAGGSPLGLRLAAALEEFGLVDHSIWQEMNGK